MYLYWGYLQNKNYASTNNILKIMNFLKKITFCTFWLTYMPKILTPPSFVIVYMMTYCRCLWCLLILYLVANCQMSSGPHGPIFVNVFSVQDTFISQGETFCKMVKPFLVLDDLQCHNFKNTLLLRVHIMLFL